MALAKITSKGQVTIPQNVREALNLHTGDKIDISVTENGEAIIKPIVKKVDDVFGFLKNEKNISATDEEIKLAIKNRLKAKFK